MSSIDIKSERPGAIRSQNLVGQLGDDLRARIHSGFYKAGDRLNITNLAKQYGVSATPVREALAKLSAEGVAAFRENAGYSVAPAPTKEEYIQWAQARVAIETQGIMLHEGPVAPSLLSQLNEINARIASGVSGSGIAEMAMFSDANWEFHGALVSLAQNVFLSKAHETLYRGRRFSQVFLGRGVVNRRDIVQEHDEIIKSLEYGDLEQACDNLTKHIETSVSRDREFAPQER